MKKRGILTVISGFSGAGKGTLVKGLVEKYNNYALSISMTTRKPRSGEEDGVHYFFIDKEQFEKNIADRKMLEYANYVGNYYGTPKEYVEKMLNEGKDVILEIEYKGAFKVKEMLPETLMLFVIPPSAKELYKRLKSRGTECDEVICGRMKRAIEEADVVDSYDFILLNENLEDCIRETHEIIQNEKYSVSRNTEFIKQIKDELVRLSKGD